MSKKQITKVEVDAAVELSYLAHQAADQASRDASDAKRKYDSQEAQRAATANSRTKKDIDLLSDVARRLHSALVNVSAPAIEQYMEALPANCERHAHALMSSVIVSAAKELRS